MKNYIYDFLDYGSVFLAIIVVISMALICFYLLRKALMALKERGQISEKALGGARNIGRWLIIAFALLFILQQFGVQVSSIISSLLAISAMISIGFIAVWSVLSNLLCSVLLVVFRPFQIGDEIEITEPFGGSSLRGKVMKFNVMYTSLLENIEGDEVVTSIPNNIFFQKAIRRRTGLKEN